MTSQHPRAGRAIPWITFSVALLAACSDSKTDPIACPAGYSRDLSGRCCTALGQCLGSSPSCGGANATPTATGGCSCVAPYKDCNGDISIAGGNGYECATSCSGTQCAMPATCDPSAAHACGLTTSFCDPSKGACAACPAGGYDCDGLGTTGCESSDARCGNAGQCSPATAGACVSSDRYCDANELRCKPCPAGQYNCDGHGLCEEFAVCAGGCLPECQAEAQIYCVKDPARGNLCTPCLEDAHCRANSHSRGPFCHPTQHLCYCNTAQDCAGDIGGALCKEAGSVNSCGCNGDSDCKVAPYTKCSPVVFGTCIKACTSKQDCPGTQECDLASGSCYDAMP